MSGIAILLKPWIECQKKLAKLIQIPIFYIDFNLVQFITILICLFSIFIS